MKERYGEPNIPELHPDRNFFIDWLTGGVSAAISKTCIAPVERVKLILQVQDASATIAKDRRFNGIIDTFLRVPKEQGFFSFWRGNMTNVMRYFPQQALNFAFKDKYKEVIMHGLRKEENFMKFYMLNLASGGAAGGTSLFFVYPLDYARTRLALDVGRGRTREYYGLTDCIIRTLKSDGLLGVYRGFFVSLQFVVIHRAAFFGNFDTIKSFMGEQSHEMDFLTAFGIGLFVTISAGLTSYPWDSVRRRMMMQSGRIDKLYKNSYDCVKRILREEGIKSLYKGSLTNVLRGAGGALTLTFYDQFKKHIDHYQHENHHH